MSKLIRVKPKKDLKVPYPESRRFLPEAGADVPKTRYWINRIKEGDVEEISSDPKKQKQDPPPVTTEEGASKATKKKTKKTTTKKQQNLEGEK